MIEEYVLTIKALESNGSFDKDEQITCEKDNLLSIYLDKGAQTMSVDYRDLIIDDCSSQYTYNLFTDNSSLEHDLRELIDINCQDEQNALYMFYLTNLLAYNNDSILTTKDVSRDLDFQNKQKALYMFYLTNLLALAYNTNLVNLVNDSISTTKDISTYNTDLVNDGTSTIKFS